MTPTRPTQPFWNDGAAPALHPGMNDRETAMMDYAEALASEASITAKAASFTLALVDKGDALEVTSASAVVVTVPTDAAVAFPVGSWVEIDRMGAGTVTVAAAGGVTIVSAGGLLALRAQYSGAVLRKRAANSWLLTGDLA